MPVRDHTQDAILEQRRRDARALAERLNRGEITSEEATLCAAINSVFDPDAAREEHSTDQSDEPTNDLIAAIDRVLPCRATTKGVDNQ